MIIHYQHHHSNLSVAGLNGCGVNSCQFLLINYYPSKTKEVVIETKMLN